MENTIENSQASEVDAIPAFTEGEENGVSEITNGDELEGFSQLSLLNKASHVQSVEIFQSVLSDLQNELERSAQ